MSKLQVVFHGREGSSFGRAYRNDHKRLYREGNNIEALFQVTLRGEKNTRGEYRVGTVYVNDVGLPKLQGNYKKMYRKLVREEVEIKLGRVFPGLERINKTLETKKAIKLYASVVRKLTIAE